MGTLVVERVEIALDDELLNHVFAVLVAKLRRRETTTLSWRDATGAMEEVFVGPHAIVEARFESERTDDLDRDWLERLMIAANSVSGISLTAADAHRHDDLVPSPPPPRLR